MKNFGRRELIVLSTALFGLAHAGQVSAKVTTAANALSAISTVLSNAQTDGTKQGSTDGNAANPTLTNFLATLGDGTSNNPIISKYPALQDPGIKQVLDPSTYQTQINSCAAAYNTAYLTAFSNTAFSRYQMTGTNYDYNSSPENDAPSSQIYQLAYVVGQADGILDGIAGVDNGTITSKQQEAFGMRKGSNYRTSWFDDNTRPNNSNTYYNGYNNGGSVGYTRELNVLALIAAAKAATTTVTTTIPTTSQPATTAAPATAAPTATKTTTTTTPTTTKAATTTTTSTALPTVLTVTKTVTPTASTSASTSPILNNIWALDTSGIMYCRTGTNQSIIGTGWQKVPGPVNNDTATCVAAAPNGVVFCLDTSGVAYYTTQAAVSANPGSTTLWTAVPGGLQWVGKFKQIAVTTEGTLLTLTVNGLIYLNNNASNNAALTSWIQVRPASSNVAYLAGAVNNTVCYIATPGSANYNNGCVYYKMYGQKQTFTGPAISVYQQQPWRTINVSSSAVPGSDPSSTWPAISIASGISGITWYVSSTANMSGIILYTLDGKTWYRIPNHTAANIAAGASGLVCFATGTPQVFYGLQSDFNNPSAIADTWKMIPNTTRSIQQISIGSQ